MASLLKVCEGTNVAQSVKVRKIFGCDDLCDFAVPCVWDLEGVLGKRPESAQK